MEEYSDRTPADIARYPMVPIRDVVIFPFTKVAFKIGRPGSVRALEMALASDRTIFLSTQHDATVDEPTPDQIYGVGTIARLVFIQSSIIRAISSCASRSPGFTCTRGSSSTFSR